MKLFHKRPLSLILCVILSGFSLFAIISPLNKAIAISVSLLLAVLVFAIPKFFGGKIGKIAVIALIFSFVLSFTYFDVLFYPNEFNGKKCLIEANVVDNEQADTHQSLSLNVKSINGKRVYYKFKLLSFFSFPFLNYIIARTYTYVNGFYHIFILFFASTFCMEKDGCMPSLTNPY